MSALIKTLKSEHLKIIDTLKEVEEFGILTHKGQDKLMSMKSSLIEHLYKEDEKLYPFFYKAAEQSKKFLELLANDLETVTRGVTGFFDKYSKGVIDSNFQREYERLFDALSKRMVYEEDILYVEYEELNKL